MAYEEKVFHSEITRVDFEQKNNLYELLNVIPAIPIPVETSQNETCPFKPRCDKYYVPKKKSRLKVRTVKEIRNLFEQDNYSYIIEVMEKQQSALLAKIRKSSATDVSTKDMAKKILIADHPISRTAWQMLNNINPDKNANPTQFVLWNGRRIRVVGSKGGKNKFICNHDLGKNNIEEIKKKGCLEKCIRRKNRLLHNSLNIKFKPGPLRKKKNLDDSHQKYHMGPVELVKLPQPTLEIQPTYGTVVEPIMSNFLNKLRCEDGTITKKWAEFAVSVLGTVHNNSIVQVDEHCCVTFKLKYKYDQDRILMRRDIGKMSSNNDNAPFPEYALQSESDNVFEIQETLNKMLDSVEISLKQDNMFTTENESPQRVIELFDDRNTNTAKDKNKKKYGELDRLAVTVIQLPGTPEQNSPKHCGKSFCNLGCICNSLSCTYKFKQHCGNLECMFGCKCELAKYKDIEMLENDCAELIPGLMKLDNEINANLAKEEQKFHQTVVVSGEKSILLKSRKRTSKSTMKYAEFFSNMRMKNEQEPKKILTIVSKKLNCAKIEPWCMVHNLYKCFCKGRFTETSVINTVVPITNTKDDPGNSNLSDYVDTDNRINVPKTRASRSRECSEKNNSICIVDDDDDVSRDNAYYHSPKQCARTAKYIGRKYDDGYYKITNNKILEMEKNDTKLHAKMMKLIKNTSAPSPKSSGTTTIILSDLSSSEETPIGNRSNKKGNDSCNKNKDLNQKLEIRNNSESHNNNTSIIENTKELSLNQIDITKQDSPNNSKTLNEQDSETLFLNESSEQNIPFEISGDIYKPIKKHLNQATQEFLTPWIAKSYRHYKEQLNNGKSTLERPKKGRIILHLWECLLDRYRNRRNVFLTTTKRPFRVYIATDTKKPFFKDCINIDAIRFSDLHKYPILVKKLLTNVSNKDYFCILGGWNDCWEIIGTVKKNDSVNNDPSSDPDLSNSGNSSQDSDFAEENWKADTADCLPRQEINEMALENNNFERSKWFLMRFENDFTEIYCHKKGFYVEREKILHAINLARVTRKTVVINKQTCTETTNIPFGIYALPDTTEYCAVVGPYEIDESLGLEIVKTFITGKEKATKGYWITTNKIDNIKVLDDPLSFLPSKTAQNELCSTISENVTNHFNINDDSNNSQSSTSQQNERSVLKKMLQQSSKANKDIIEKKIPKIVKPIKIRRTNGFYHLTSNNNMVKKILPKAGTSPLGMRRLGINTQQQQFLIINDPNENLANDPNTLINTGEQTGAEQLKITSVYSESDTTITNKNENNKISGMLILKPEEINKKVCEKPIIHDGNEASIEMDIENFLATPGCSTSGNDVLFMSDQDDPYKTSEKWTNVWIHSSNINNLGWICGKRNDKNLLSIDFPGFKPTDLYKDKDAFKKINQVLKKKIKIPNDIKINWQVSSTDISKRLKGANLVEVLENKKNEISQSSGESPTLTTRSSPRLFEDDEIVNTVHVINSMHKQNIDFEGLEETSRLLEDERIFLWNETEKRQTEIMQRFCVPDEIRTEMSGALQDLLLMNDDLADG